jgi:Cupredoxin-like domain
MKNQLRILILPAMVLVAFCGAGGAQAAGVDPRTGGLDVALGEWSLVAESTAIRPGRVTVVVVNRGKVPHGFRIRGGGYEENKGGDNRFEVRTRMLKPGQTAKVPLNLGAGVYSLECFVEDRHGDHEARGMRAPLRVSPNAPLVQPKTVAPGNVLIRGFAFGAGTTTVPLNTTVRWTNADAAPHTVSAKAGAFGSTSLGKGQRYTHVFAQPGRFEYFCAIHPTMKGAVVVR